MSKVDIETWSRCLLRPVHYELYLLVFVLPYLIFMHFDAVKCLGRGTPDKPRKTQDKLKNEEFKHQSNLTYDRDDTQSLVKKLRRLFYDKTTILRRKLFSLPTKAKFSNTFIVVVQPQMNPGLLSHNEEIIEIVTNWPTSFSVSPDFVPLTFHIKTRVLQIKPEDF